VALWLFVATRGEPVGESKGRALNLRALFEAGTGPVWALFAIATLRAIPITSFAYFISVVGKARGWELTTVRWVLSLFMSTGVVGGLVGGYLGDRMNRRVLMAVSCVASAPLFFGFAALRGWASVPALGGAGLVLALAAPLNVSLAQELRPQSASMVSGVMMGLAWGLANVILLAVGALAEAVGIERALEGVALVGPLAAALVVFLPAREGDGAA